MCCCENWVLSTLCLPVGCNFCLVYGAGKVTAIETWAAAYCFLIKSSNNEVLWMCTNLGKEHKFCNSFYMKFVVDFFTHLSSFSNVQLSSWLALYTQLWSREHVEDEGYEGKCAMVCNEWCNLFIFPPELKGKLQQYHWKANLRRRLLKMVGVRNVNYLL